MADWLPIPDAPLSFVPVKAGEVLRLGQVTVRVLEDGSHTDNRLGVCELILPPKTPGPPPHWHEMHDETFMVTKGTVRFHVPDKDQPGKDKEIIDAQVGDFVALPTRSPHTFSNPSNEESRVHFTATPAFYINYFKLLSTLGKPGEPMPAEANMQAMALYATKLVDNQPRKPQ
ncbi:hypothetical protein AMS68_001942 [Peltaster fructicola]|uniref:Cupin type-2 domain-containing protein n=1 Tax=Peltaster fructicola TaxID=286661 RepID=A0A6H0XP70_9PEZI|nr:hypothetical protein AMS68_001942 [Peltaster fructicola]